MTFPMPAHGTAPSALPLAHARAARRSGALGGAMVGVGLPLALSPVVAWAFSSFFVWTLSLPSSGASDETTEEDVAYLTRIADLVASPLGIAVAVACVVVGLGLVVVGVMASVRGLRRAGVHRPVTVALLGLLLARIGVWVVGAVVGGLPELLGIAWLWPLMSIAGAEVFQDGDALTDLTSVVLSLIVVLVGVIAAAGAWLGVALLTTWWMATAMRQRVPVLVAMQPWPTDAWTTTGASQSHQPDATARR